MVHLFLKEKWSLQSPDDVEPEDQATLRGLQGLVDDMLRERVCSLLGSVKERGRIDPREKLRTQGDSRTAAAHEAVGKELEVVKESRSGKRDREAPKPPPSGGPQAVVAPGAGSTGSTDPITTGKETDPEGQSPPAKRERADPPQPGKVLIDKMKTGRYPKGPCLT